MTKDIEILKDGPICKYFKNSILDEDVTWFIENRFDVYDMNVRNWNKEIFHKKIKKELNFPDYYGENLNAFNDCHGDLYNDRYKGVVIVFRQYEEFLSSDRNFAEVILDIIATESRYWLVTGKKLMELLSA